MKFLSLFVCACLLLDVSANVAGTTRRANKGNTEMSANTNGDRNLASKGKGGKGKAHKMNKLNSSKEGKGKGGGKGGAKDSKKSSKKSSKKTKMGKGKGGQGDVSMSPSSMPTPVPTGYPSAMPSKTPIAVSMDISNDAISVDEGPISNDAISVDNGPISNDAISVDEGPISNDAISVDEGPISNDAISVDEGNRGGTVAPNGGTLPVPPTDAPSKAATTTTAPTAAATKAPVVRLTKEPTASPTINTSDRNGTVGPSLPEIPVAEPTDVPSPEPTDSPIPRLTVPPTQTPTKAPTGKPVTSEPTKTPTGRPTRSVTGSPTKTPSSPPPTGSPTKGPTKSPTGSPTKTATGSPTKAPSSPPSTESPTKGPTKIPTGSPTEAPAAEPTKAPTKKPTGAPTKPPVDNTPVAPPTEAPTSSPTVADRVGDNTGDVIPLISILQGRLEPNSYYGGAEFEDTNSYQYKALRRVEQQDGVELMDDDRLIQYYVLYCIYQAAGGSGWVDADGWTRNDLSPCGGFFGVSCDEDNLIVGINMYDNNLSGTFPPEITLLASDGYRSTGAGHLRSLDLYLNPNLGNGNDNHWVSELGRALKYLFLGKTAFGGSIPRLPLGLIEFDASNTNINGGLVASNFEGLNHLTWLLLDGCSFQTSIPTEFAQLPKLEYFYISDADITGDLSYLEGMPVLFEHFASNNPGLGGELYSFIGDIDSLASLNLSGNSLEGTIPNSIGDLANLQQLWLNDNNLTGRIPNQMSRLISLKTLELEGNNFVGNFPPNICELKEPGYGYLTKLGADCTALKCECCDCCSTELCLAL